MPTIPIWDTVHENLLWIPIRETPEPAEFQQMLDDATQLVRQRSGRIDIIVLVEAPAPYGNPFPLLREGLYRLRALEQIRLLVVVVPLVGSLMRSSLILVTRVILPQRADQIHFISSTEEALELIRADRERCGE